jgi:hypothetical protein
MSRTTINVTNDLEKKIDERLNDLINDSYTRPDGGYDRAKYQRLVAQRRAGRLDGKEKISIQAPEYFDNEDPVYRKIMEGQAYAQSANDYAKNLERLKKMDSGRYNDLTNVRDDIRTYLGSGFGVETAPGAGDIEKLTSVPELFVKERHLDENTTPYKLVNVADLVNHIHYKVMVDRKIPHDSSGAQYSYENINNINKAARERLAPYVKAFLATYEMTPAMIRRVYAQKDTNMVPGTGKPQPQSNLRGVVGSLNSAVGNDIAIAGLASTAATYGALPMAGGNPDKLYKMLRPGQAGGKKKKSRGKKKSKKSKKSRKSKK